MVLSFALALVTAQQVAWVPAGRGPGALRWYTREKAGSAVRELRATSLLPLPPALVWEVLTDFEGYVQTLPGTVEAKVLRSDEVSADVYLRYVLPLISARDTVVQMRAEADPARGRWQLSWSSTENRDAPTPPGDTVRLARNVGSWRLSSREDGKATFVEYELHSPPGGGVPPFIVNQVKGRGVPETFAALERAARLRSRD